MAAIPLQQFLQAGLAICRPLVWLQMLEEENIQLLILDAQLDTELIETARLQPEWKVDSEDDELVIFTSAER